MNEENNASHPPCASGDTCYHAQGCATACEKMMGFNPCAPVAPSVQITLANTAPPLPYTWISVADFLPAQGAPVALKGEKDGAETTCTGQLFCLYHTGKPCWATAHTRPFAITHWYPLPR